MRNNLLIIDSHCDTPSQILRLRNIGIDNDFGHVDIPKMKRGGVSASFFALYTPKEKSGDEATSYAFEMLAGVMDAISENSNDIALATSPSDIYSNKDKGFISILLGMENGSPVRKSLSLLREFFRLGVRYMTLVHNADNDIADSAAQAQKWGGLSPFGIEVVEEMNRLGMMIDVAHISDKAFYDCLKYSSKPIVSTHSCCRALASHRRNMTDDMIKKMSDKGGVIQINFYPSFLSDTFATGLSDWYSLHPDSDKVEQAFIEEPGNELKRKAWERMVREMETLSRPGVEAIAEHIDHAVKVGGIDHVGIGSDFDGIDVTPSGMEDISHIGRLFDELSRRKYTDDQIEKIAGKNFLRVFQENLQ